LRLLYKTEHTVCDIIDATISDIDKLEMLEVLLEVIEEELYVCEDRRGGTDIVVSDLYELSSFIRNRLMPLNEIGHFKDVDDSPKKMLQRFMESKITERTCTHMLLQSNTPSIYRSIQTISGRN
jgi:hypothetical protein